MLIKQSFIHELGNRHYCTQWMLFQRPTFRNQPDQNASQNWHTEKEEHLLRADIRVKKDGFSTAVDIWQLFSGDCGLLMEFCKPCGHLGQVSLVSTNPTQNNVFLMLDLSPSFNLHRSLHISTYQTLYIRLHIRLYRSLHISNFLMQMDDC